MKRCMTVLRDESGGVTVDFVVLSAMVVALAMLIAPTFGPSVSSMAEYVGETMAEYEGFLDD